MRPPAPVPLTRLRSMLFSRAIFRTSGESGPDTSAAASAGGCSAGFASGSTGGGAGAATGAAATGAGASGAFSAGAAAGAGAAASAPPSSAMRATTVLIPTVAPSSTSTSDNVPAAGEGISVSTLSVEISNNGSSRSTRSPRFLSHLVSVPSTMLSPIWGITTSVISVLSFRGGQDGRLEQHLTLENAAEMGGKDLRNFRQRSAHAKLRHGSHRLGKPAGDNVLKIAQIRIHVQRETVRRHPPAEVHSDGGDFAIAHPNPSQLGNAAGFNAELRQRFDERLLDGTHVRAHVALPIAQVQNRVAHELPRSVIRHVAAAIGWIKPTPGAAKDLARSQQILYLSVAPQRDHVRVFQKQQVVPHRALFALGSKLLLQFQRLAIIDAPEFPHAALTH